MKLTDLKGEVYKGVVLQIRLEQLYTLEGAVNFGKVGI